MEQRKWLWKRKSSDKSSGETDSSGSLSSHSERYSDDQQEAFKGSLDNSSQSPEVSSKVEAETEHFDNGSLQKEEFNDSVGSLTHRLSAALVNVSAKEDLVKQHAKVAEEAIAGWEKAENEVSMLKKKLEASAQQNSALEDRVSHLDGALRECVRQLRQAREEQEKKVQEAVSEKTREWESTKSELQTKLLELHNLAEANDAELSAQIDPDLRLKLEYLEKENSSLKAVLHSQAEDLELATIERDLSTNAAETANKQHLESIKKVAKLEAECRKLKAMACKGNDQKSTAASSTYADSFMESHSDSGECLNNSDLNKCKLRASDSWASALISEFGQFRNEKTAARNPPTSSVQINLMDDFLEMERLAGLEQNESGETKVAQNHPANMDSSLRTKLEAMTNRVDELEEKLENFATEKAELEEKLENLETVKAELDEEIEKLETEKYELIEELEKFESEKAELETALSRSEDQIEASQLQLTEAEMKLEELQRELNVAKESKQVIESQLICTEAEGQTMSAKVESLEEEVQRERALSIEVKSKYRDLEKELLREREEVQLLQTARANAELKIKQEDLDVAAGKLAECQKTIASLGSQLKSLATLDDFLIDTANIPGISVDPPQIPKVGEQWKLHSNETFSPKREYDSSKQADESCNPPLSKTDENSPPSSSSSLSTSSPVLSGQISSEKNRNGFAKFFSRTKSGLRLEI